MPPGCRTLTLGPLAAKVIQSEAAWGQRRPGLPWTAAHPVEWLQAAEEVVAGTWAHPRRGRHSGSNQKGRTPP